MTRKNMLIAAGILLIAAAVVAATLWYRRDPGLTVTVEAIKARDLEAIVSASGKIQPKRLVNISADTPGRVVNLAVNEGDRVAKGQFLLQIDPQSLRTRVDNSAAGLRAAESSLDQMRQAVETSRVQMEQAQKNLARQRELWAEQLSTREALEIAESDLRSAESGLHEREKQVSSQAARIAQERASLESARYDLSKVRLESPIDGIVTRRNIQEGETAMIGTMNNAGTVLLTLADMSVIQAEVEVDETNIPNVSLGQPATITIDALPERTFRGHVTEIGNSPIQAVGAQTTQTQATNFKVVVMLDEPIPDVRPGFTCTADITTATRANVTAVPIPAVAVRELVYDANNQIVRAPRDPRRRRTASVEPVAVAVAAELEPGETRKETEGVFVVRNAVVEYIPIKLGISGDRYFEVREGLKPGDQVVTGPYNSVRTMVDGDTVKVETPKAR
ncbi:MAG: efflux RND transporter periplasmic adaptor subunit [Luteitalea sp.]|nr:efflux RND transporter periplasmic adaptor subunit [Luteitalea sp.]